MVAASHSTTTSLYLVAQHLSDTTDWQLMTNTISGTITLSHATGDSNPQTISVADTDGITNTHPDIITGAEDDIVNIDGIGVTILNNTSAKMLLITLVRPTVNGNLVYLQT